MENMNSSVSKTFYTNRYNTLDVADNSARNKPRYRNKCESSVAFGTEYKLESFSEAESKSIFELNFSI